MNKGTFKNMGKLKKIISQIEIWENWKESYKKFVPRFIKEAKTKFVVGISIIIFMENYMILRM